MKIDIITREQAIELARQANESEKEKRAREEHEAKQCFFSWLENGGGDRFTAYVNVLIKQEALRECNAAVVRSISYTCEAYTGSRQRQNKWVIEWLSIKFSEAGYNSVAYYLDKNVIQVHWTSI
jgi:hypothetical protein